MRAVEIFTCHVEHHFLHVRRGDYAPEQISALKQAADVCLHPSRVEGFGMNVLECQYFGTLSYLRISRRWQLLHVSTCGTTCSTSKMSARLCGSPQYNRCRGVENVYNGVWKGSAAAAKQWIENDFSTTVVVHGFEQLLQNTTLVRLDTSVRRVTGEHMDIMGVDENRLWTIFGQLKNIPPLPDNSDVVRILQRGAVVAVMVKNCLLLNMQIQTTWVPKVLYTIMNAPHVVTTDVVI